MGSVSSLGLDPNQSNQPNGVTRRSALASSTNNKPFFVQTDDNTDPTSTLSITPNNSDSQTAVNTGSLTALIGNLEQELQTYLTSVGIPDPITAPPIIHAGEVIPQTSPTAQLEKTIDQLSQLEQTVAASNLPPAEKVLLEGLISNLVALLKQLLALMNTLGTLPTDARASISKTLEAIQSEVSKMMKSMQELLDMLKKLSTNVNVSPTAESSQTSNDSSL